MSFTNTASTVVSDADRYTFSGSHGAAFVKTGGVARKFFKPSKLLLHSVVHSKLLDLDVFFMASNIGRHLLEACGMKRRSAAMQPVKI